MQITKVIQKKNPLDFTQLDALMKKASEARKTISDAKENLDAQKEAFKDLSEQLNVIIDKCFEDYDRGFTLENVECTVTYDNHVASYYNAQTGEKVEGIPLEEGEQLEMTGGRRDAEELIRESSREEN